MTALGAHEAEHVKFLRSVLAENTTFETSLSFNRAGIDAVLSDRDHLEHGCRLRDTGVCIQWGGDKPHKSRISTAGLIVSVEARHAAAGRGAIAATCHGADSR